MSSEIRAKIKKMNSMLSQLYKEQTDPNKQEIIDRYSGYLLELQKMEKSILTKEEHTIDISSNNEIKILPETLGDFYLLEKDDRIVIKNFYSLYGSKNKIGKRCRTHIQSGSKFERVGN